MQLVKQKVLHRLAIAKGHLNKVVSMVENDSYCIDVVHQSLAVQAALKEVDSVILKNHMETCVADSIRQGKTKEVVQKAGLVGQPLELIRKEGGIWEEVGNPIDYKLEKNLFDEALQATSINKFLLTKCR